MMPPIAEDSIVQEITISAPAERIFEALTNPAELVQWWRAEGRFQATNMESELQPKGRWVMQGIGMNGKPFTIRGTYREIVRPRLLAFTWLPDWQLDAVETLVRIELEEKNGVTTVRLTHSGLSTDQSRANHKGWPELLSSLRAYAQRQKER
jgi:uncharacterized protein YndB with AHSA1/START domain